MPGKTGRAPVPSKHQDLCETMPQEQQALIREVISHVTDKWSLWALSELTEGEPLRFARLLERLEGISQKSLTATLRQLERNGFVTRTVTAQVPIRVDYAATALGHALIRKVHPLWLWTVQNLDTFVHSRSEYDRRHPRAAPE